MKENAKELFVGIVATIIFAVLFTLAIFYATSAEVWYAGEHTAGCDNSEDCGCYEKLIKK